MKTTRLKWMPHVVLAAIAVFLLAGCGSTKQTGSASSNSTDQKQKIKVVAAENFYGEVAQAVGGDHVQVTSIITNPSADPHDYEATANDSKAVADAQVVVYNGIGYDDWVAKMLKADSSAQNKEIVVVGKDLSGKVAGDNPHVWYDPSTMPKLTKKLADDLGKLDPSNAQDYQKRANDYIRSLAPLTAQVTKLRQSIPVNIEVSEPVFDYMANALNLNVNDPKFAKAVEEGNEPSAADIANVQKDIKNKEIKFFVYNTQTDMPTVKNIVKLAESNGIPIVRVTETEPTGKNYLQWMTAQLDQVGKVFGVQ
jgi:zinc/manganese transport system substrate-binding protein